MGGRGEPQRNTFLLAGTDDGSFIQINGASWCTFYLSYNQRGFSIIVQLDSGAAWFVTRFIPKIHHRRLIAELGMDLFALVRFFDGNSTDLVCFTPLTDTSKVSVMVP